MKPLPFTEAVDWAAQRDVVLPDVYYGEMQGQARSAAFSVAGLAKLDQLELIKRSLTEATEQGFSYAAWARHVQQDPIALGLPYHRLENIFRTNLQNHYNRGRCEKQSRTTAALPWFMYDAVNDSRTRPHHAAMDGMIARHDDPVWKVWNPPNGYQCRCRRVAMTERQAERARGFDKAQKSQGAADARAEALKEGPDPGWDYNICHDVSEGLKRAVEAKQAAEYAAWLEAQKAAARESIKLSKKAQLEAVKQLGQVELARSQAKAGARFANAQWELAKAGDLGKWYAQAVKKGATPDELKETAEALQAAWKAKMALGYYKKAKINGKKPKANWAAAYNGLSEAEKAKIDEEIAKAKAAAKAAEEPAVVGGPEPPPPPVTPAAQNNLTSALVTQNTDAWVQTGEKKGSNKGGFFRDADGVEWYLKFPDDLHNAKNEVLANRLYALAGIEVPEMTMITRDGKHGVASKVIPGLKEDPAALQAGTVDGVHKGFAVDAWLANWDVVGLTYDNLMVGADGRAYRIDPGGALEFRAQGELKGAAFGTKITELDTLRDAGKNSQAASVFGNIDEAEIKASAAQVVALSDDAIRQTVLTYGHGSTAAKNALADKLIKRKADLSLKYPDVAAKVEQLRIAELKNAEMEIITKNTHIHNGVLTALKGIVFNALEGNAIRDVDVTRVAAAWDVYNEFVQNESGKVTAATLSGMRAKYEPWLTWLSQTVEPGVGQKANTDGKPGTKFEAFDDFDIHVLPTAGGMRYDPRAFGFKVPLSNASGAHYPWRSYDDFEIGEIIDAANFDRHAAVPNDAGKYPAQLDVLTNAANEAQLRPAYLWTTNVYNYVTKPILLKTASKEIEAYAEMLHSVLESLPKYTGTITRGLRFNRDTLTREWVDDHIDAWRTGRAIDSKLPASWGHGGKSFGGDVVMKIERSTRGVHVEPISHYAGMEDEVLMPRFNYRVKQVLEGADVPAEARSKGASVFILVEEVEA